VSSDYITIKLFFHLNDFTLFLRSNGIKTNAVAPRLFCDICDLFDLHDTEDCPKQASDDVIETPSMMLYIDSPSSNEHSRHGGRREQSRPYCEVCEIFGHATGDCDEDATF